MSKKVIGIDLGSTLSEVSIMEGGKPTIIINEEGSRTTPSVISFKDGERKVGSAAKRQAVTNPKETVVLIKRFMGGTYDEVKDNISHIQYDVKNVNGMPRIVIGDKEFAPEELSAMILAKMKKVAEDYIGEEVTDAVITVPAYFSESAKEATKRAGEIAGLNVLRLVAEPTAAILASNIDMEKGGKYMVVDYGGATLDFSVADISDNVVEILASNGDVYCGGSDIDKLVAFYIRDEFKAAEGIDLSGDKMAMTRIFEAAEKAKIVLSNESQANVNIPYITSVDNVAKHIEMTINRAKFERIIDAEINKVMSCGKKALAQAGVSAEELNGVLLVGGSTRIPKVQEELIKVFGDKLIKSLNPDEAVALGASVQGGILAGEVQDILLLDVTPLSLGIETMGGVVHKLIEANTTIPTKKSEIFTTAEDNQPSVPIAVYQGERPMARDNKQIGFFVLDGILPARRGEPQIEVTFDIDANGLLSVSAVDKGTGKEQHIKIESSTKLSDEEVERMKREAQEYAEADKKAKETADKLNAADTMAFQTEKYLNELGDKIEEADKTELRGKLDALNEELKSRDIEKIEPKQKELEEVWHKISEKLYKSAQPEGQGNIDPNAMKDLFGQNNPFAGGGQNPFGA